jgi:hypothetical protein
MKKVHANIYFEFTKSQQLALFVLFGIILCIQGLYYFTTSHLPPNAPISNWYYIQSKQTVASSTGEKKYPIYLFDSDTSGEKLYEEFYTEDETINESRFNSLGVIYKKSNYSRLEINKILHNS